jgi:hypothetical protein
MTVMPTRLNKLLVSLLALFVCGTDFAQSGTTDWKYYGQIKGTPTKPGAPVRTTLMFFDAKGVRHLPDGHLTVWTKALNEADVDKYASVKNGPVMQETAHRVANYYAPPLASLLGVSPDKALQAYLDFVTWEVAANSTPIPSTMRVLDEIDCQNQTMRSLSVQILSAGQGSMSNDRPGDWVHAAPETNGGYLVAMLCKGR